jgi:ubiquinol-cytochrome c reductase cytochrome c subunit
MTPDGGRGRGAAGRRRHRAAGLLVCALAIAGACTIPQRRQPEPYAAPAVRQADPTTTGSVLYARECAWCHGGRGEGTDFGPNLNDGLDGGAYTDFMLSTGRMPIDDPSQRVVRRPVELSDAQIAAIVAHVESLGGTGPAVPSPDPRAGDLASGQRLYQENCAACHAMTAVGGAVASGRVAPPLDRSTAVQVAEAMLVGPGCSSNNRSCGPGTGAMPRFAFSPQQVNDITRYVLYLHRPDDAGGWPILGIGPVAEGAIGLLVGLGLLLVVARWIGTTREQDERA